jgi:glyoxylase-like metal-dependent hydrolase (beta-lactamase superfamily II)
MARETEYQIEELAPDVARLRVAFVNCFFIGSPRKHASALDATPWMLIDTALSIGAARILEVAAERFGSESRPAAIVLTHGHFDHVGALEALLGIWDVPVYAHPLELPFLTGRADYPPPDPTVARSGLMARLSPMFPDRGVDISKAAQALPTTGDVPGAPGWRWVPTPGHSPGHVSFFRGSDRLLIAGDAVTTTKQESVFAVATQKQELHGPPAYFTIDWDAAHRSVATLASLKPLVLASGHGQSMRGDDMPERLAELARDFDVRERPRRGRYARESVIANEDGIVYIPPPVRNGGVPWAAVSGVAAAAVAGTWLVRRFGARAAARANAAKEQQLSPPGGVSRR